MCVCLSSCRWVCRSVCLSLSVCLSVSQSVDLSVCLSVCLSVYLSICLSVSLSVCQSVSQSFCLSVCLSVLLCIYLSVCLSIYLSIRSFCSHISLIICFAIDIITSAPHYTLHHNVVNLEPGYNEGPRNWQNTFAIKRLLYRGSFPYILLLLPGRGLSFVIPRRRYIEAR